MTGDQRHALLLAARLIEAGLVPDAPPEPAVDGHVWQGLFIASRLQSVLGVDGAAAAAPLLRDAARAA